MMIPEDSLQISVFDARNRLSRLIRVAESGTEVVIANRGRPVARLVPVVPDAKTAANGAGRDVLSWLEAHPLPAHARRSHDEIEHALAEEASAWD